MKLKLVTEYKATQTNEGDYVFIRALNNSATALQPDFVTVFSASTSLTEGGLKVELPSVAINLTTGLGAKVAGVVTNTIAATSLGFLQVFGAVNVRCSASLAAGKMVVTASANATNIGTVFDGSESTAVGPKYSGAIVGWTLATVNATNAIVHLSLM